MSCDGRRSSIDVAQREGFGVSNGASETLARSPIIEAVVDIDCDLPANLDLADLETQAREQFADGYPGFRRIFRPASHLFVSGGSSPPLDVRAATDAYQLLAEDEPQLVQVRRGGFSFNRFTPYTDLHHYLPEIRRTWKIFVDLMAPVAVRRIGLRYINRILLPPVEEIVELNDYLYLGSRLPEDVSLKFTAILNEYSAVEGLTDNEVKVRIVIDEYEKHPWSRETQPLPVILDIACSHWGAAESPAWENIESTIRSLRHLANAVFRSNLTERCLNLFR